MTDIQRGIAVLYSLGDVGEIRVPKARSGKGTISGYFNDFDLLAQAIEELSGKHDGIYVTVNPCNPALLARAENKIKTRVQTTTSDADILKRTRLLIDIDPVRPAGISSTDEEKQHARDLTNQVHEYLKCFEWAEPVLADSGNGYHLLYRLPDLPNTKEVMDTIKAFLKALADKFDNEHAKVDRSVFNAARIVKAYGSLAAKGDSTADRPHRRSQVIKTGNGIVKLEQIKSLIEKIDRLPSGKASNLVFDSAPSKLAKTPSTITAEILQHAMDTCGIRYHEVVQVKEGQYKWVLDFCPFDPGHVGKDAAVFLTDGTLGFKCFHNHCAENHWHEFRAKVEDDSGKKNVLPRNTIVTIGTAAVGTTASHKGDQFQSKYGYTDAGNGELFVRHNKDRVRYCPSLNHAGWFVWDGQRWIQDPLKQVTEYARAVMNAMFMSAAKQFTVAADDASRQPAKDAMNWAKSSLNHQRILNMLAQAGAGTEICVEGSVFDSHPELLNLQNGTLSLDTGEFYQARKEDLLTQIANACYMPGATCPQWQGFLNDVTEGDQETQRYLRRVFGYLLTGDQREQAFFMFYGKGGTGKTTVWKTLEGLLGNYYAMASLGLFVNSGSQQAAGEAASPAKAALAGKRVVATIELQEGVQFNEALLKLIVGGDSLTARHLYQPPFTFQPQCKPVFLTNYLPQTTDFSGGLEQRLRIVKFQKVFRGTANEVKDLYKTFVPEYDGILQWALAGLKDLREHGLQEPESVKANVQEYMHNENAVSRWLTERTISCPDEILGTEAFSDFRQWAERGNESCKKKTNKWFYAQLADLGIHSRRSEHGIELKGFRLIPFLTVGLEHKGDKVISKTETTIDRDTTAAIAHIIANLPVFDPENPPVPTANEHFVVTLGQLVPWYSDHFRTAIESHNISLVAVQGGFRIELIPLSKESEKQCPTF